MKFMFFSIKYRYSDILLKKKHQHILSRLHCCNHTCYCINIVYVTSASHYITPASRYYPRYQSRSSMYIRGLIPRNSAELAEAVPSWDQRLKHVRISLGHDPFFDSTCMERLIILSCLTRFFVFPLIYVKKNSTPSITTFVIGSLICLSTRSLYRPRSDSFLGAI